MTDNSLKSRIIRWLIYSFVGSLTFFITFNLFMDWDLIKKKVSKEMEKMSGYDVAVGDISFGLSSLKITDIVMVSRPTTEGEKKSRFKISSLEIKSNLFKLFKGNKNVEFKMEALGGTTSGSFSKDKSTKKFQLEMDDINIKKIPLLSSAISLPIKGKISLDGNVELNKYGWRKANGEFNITFKNIVVGDGKTKVKAKFLQPPKSKGQAKFQKDGFPLPPLSLGNKFSWTVTIKNGKAEIKDFATQSKDGEAELVGHIKFRDPMKLSMVEMYMKFKFSEESKKNDDTLQVFELSLIRRGKRADGYLGLSITGQLSKLRFLPRKTGIIDYRKHKKNGLRKRGKKRINSRSRKRSVKKSNRKGIGARPFRPTFK